MFGLFRKRRSTCAPASSDVAPVILRDEASADDRRRLTARYAANGDLLIEGQDIGKSVEAFFGSREYEWAWTIAKSDHPKLLRALGTTADLMRAIKGRFSGDEAARIEAFLKTHGVPYSFWSRSGD